MFFKKKAIQFSVVDKPKTAEDTPSIQDKILDPKNAKLIAEHGKDVIKCLALTVVGAYAVFKTIDTLSQIAVKKTKSADND